MNIKELNIVIEDGTMMPTYATQGSSGLDLYSNEPLVIPSGQRRLVKTGVKMAIPEGFEGQVRPRSGLALKHGITCLNSPGTIDSDYRGEIGVILYNTSLYEFVVDKGMRVAQLVICPIQKVSLQQVDSLDDTTRGGGGYGSTGV